MKKVLLTAGVGLCIICAAMASVGNTNTSKKSFGYLLSASGDTTPKDTSKSKFGYVSSAFADSTPKDTAKKSFAFNR